MELVALAVVVVGLLVVYAWWTAGRLDRLHQRVDLAAAALDDQLRRRAQAAAAFTAGGPLPTDSSAEVAGAAERAATVQGLGHDREAVENALSRALLHAARTAPEGFAAGPLAADLFDEATRATFARRFHNDAVRDALVVRDRRVVRWLHLAGRAPHPAYFEIDDSALPTPATAVTGSPYD